MRSNRVGDNLSLRNASRATIHDLFFNAIGAFHGFIAVNRLTPAWMIFWIIFFGQHWMSYLIDFGALSDDPSLSANMSYLVLSVSDFISTSASAYIVYSFFHKRNIIRPLLRKRGRTFNDVYPAVSYAIPLIAILAYRASRKLKAPMAALSFSSMILIETSMGTFLMVYGELLNGLIERSTELRRLCKNPEKTLDELIAAKWNLRDGIEAVNEFSSLPLVGHYVKMMGTTLIFSAMAMRKHHGVIERIAQWSHSVAHILTMYYFAWKTSTLDFQRHEMAQDILMRHSLQNFEAVLAKRVFNFRESLDVVRLGCFPHSTKSFVKSILLLYSMALPIMFQFDHLAVRRMSDLAESAVFRMQQDPVHSGVVPEGN